VDCDAELNDVKVNVKIDTSLLDKNAKRYAKNLAFSTAQALNDAAKEAQKRIRVNIRQRFHVRQAQFVDGSIKIFAFANARANRPYAEIGVDNKPRFLLSIFEEGGARLPFVGKNVAVPITGQAARPSIADPVRSDMKFTALGFKKSAITRKGKILLAVRKRGGIRKRKVSGQYQIWQGAHRTFILPQTRRAPLGGVFQRVGPGRDDIRLIYSFKANVRLRAALDFVSTSQQSFSDVFQESFYRRFYRLNA
jgi:hypothetical protein